MTTQAEGIACVLAGPAHTDCLIELARDLCFEANRTFSERRSREMLDWTMEHGGIYMAVLEDGEVAGALSFVVVPDMADGVLVGSEIGLLVRPSHRRRGVASALLEAAEGYCRIAGASRMDVGDAVMSGAMGALLAGRGYERASVTYRRAL